MLVIFLRQGEEVPMENLSLYSSGQQRGYAPNHMVSEIYSIVFTAPKIDIHSYCKFLTQEVVKLFYNKMLYSLRSFYQIARKQLLISTRYPAIAPHLLKGAFLLVATCLYLVSSILHVYCIKCL